MRPVDKCWFFSAGLLFVSCAVLILPIREDALHHGCITMLWSCSALLILRFVVCRLRGVLEQFWHRSRLHCALAMFVNVAYFDSGIFRKMCKYP